MVLDNSPVFGLPRGTWMVLAGCLFFALSGMGISLAEGIPATEIVFLRALAGLPFFYLAIRRQGLSLRGPRPYAMLLRCCSMIGVFLLTTRAYMMLPIGDAATVMHSYPVIVILLSGLVLGEKVGLRALWCALVCFVGVALCAKPSFLFGAAGLSPAGLAVALSATAVISISILLARMLSRDYPTPVIVIWPMLFAVILTPLMGVGDWVIPNNTAQWVGLIIVCLFNNVAQFSFVDGMAREPVGRSAILTFTELPMTAMLGVLFLSESYDMYSLVGAMLVAAGSLALEPAVVAMFRARLHIGHSGTKTGIQ